MNPKSPSLERVLKIHTPNPSQLPDAVELAKRGQCQQALFVAQAAAGAPDDWVGAEDLAWAGEMLAWAGAPRRGEALAVRGWRKDPENLAARRVCLELALERGDKAAVWERGCSGPALGPISEEAVALLRLLGRGWWLLGEKGQAEACWQATWVDAPSKTLAACDKWLASLNNGHPLDATLAQQVERVPKFHPRLSLAVADALAAEGQGSRALALIKAAAEGTEWVAFHLREAELHLSVGNPAAALPAIERCEASVRLGDAKLRQRTARLRALLWLTLGNPGRALESLQAGLRAVGRHPVSSSSLVLNVVHAPHKMSQLSQLGWLGEWTLLEKLQDHALAQGLACLRDEWGLAEVVEAVSRGLLVAWQDEENTRFRTPRVVMAERVETGLGAVFDAKGSIAFWDSNGGLDRGRRRVLVIFPLGEPVPPDLLSRGNAVAEQWLVKLRQALEVGELGRGWQLLREVESAAGPSAVLDEARGMIAEASAEMGVEPGHSAAVAAQYPVSPWRSRAGFQREKERRSLERKARAAEATRDFQKLEDALWGLLQWQRRNAKPVTLWNQQTWQDLLGKLLSVAERRQDLKGLVHRMCERWRHRADAHSLMDAVETAGKVGERNLIRQLLQEADFLAELEAVKRLLAARVELWEGNINEGLAALTAVPVVELVENRCASLYWELVHQLGQDALAERAAQEALRMNPRQVKLWQYLEKIEAVRDPEKGRQRIWSQALRSCQGFTPVYLAALKSARDNGGPESWSGLLLDDWEALCPSHPQMQLERGRRSLGHARYAGARTHLEKAVSHGSTRQEALALSARTHLLEGKPEAAAGVLLDAWRENPDSLPLWEELLHLAAKATIRQQLLEEAAELLLQGKAGEPLFRAWWDAAKESGHGAKQAAEIAKRRPDLVAPTLTAVRMLGDARKDAEAADLLRVGLGRHFLNAEIWAATAQMQELANRGEQNQESAFAWKQAALLGQETAPWLALATWLEKQAAAEPVRAAELAAVVAAESQSVDSWEKLAASAWARGEGTHGMRYLANALLRKPMDSRLWRILLERSQAAAKPEYPRQLAEWMAAVMPSSVPVWLAAARLFLHQRQKEPFFAAITKARELAPQGVDSFSLECQWYVQEKDYAKAQAACRPDALGTRLEDMPLALRARHAWVESTRGDLDAAIRGMRPVLEADAEYGWARQEMLGWLSATGQQQEAEAILSRSGERHTTLRQQQANRQLEQLEPLGEVSTIYEKLSLFDSHLRNKRLDAAAKLLAEMRAAEPHANPLITARAVSLAVAVSDKQRVQEALDELVGMQTDDRWSLEMAVDGYEKMFGRPRLLNYMEKMSRDLAQVRNPGFLSLWVRKLNENTWKGLPSRIMDVLETRPDAAMALLDYLKQMTDAGRKARAGRNWAKPEILAMSAALQSLIKHKGPWIKGQPELWLAVGTAWNALADHKQAYKWLSPNMPKEPPATTLDQLMLACLGTGRHAQAMDAASQGRSLPEAAQFPRFSIWPALEAVLQKDFSAADAFLAEVSTPLSEELRTAQRLTKSLSRIGQDSERPRFSDSMKNHFHEFWLANQSLKPSRYWKKGLRYLASRGLSLSPLIWGFRTQHDKTLRLTFGILGAVAVLLVIGEIKFRKYMPWHAKPTVEKRL